MRVMVSRIPAFRDPLEMRVMESSAYPAFSVPYEMRVTMRPPFLPVFMTE